MINDDKRGMINWRREHTFCCETALLGKGKGKGKAIPVQAWISPEGSRKLQHC
jgi:hypothetical protein